MRKQKRFTPPRTRLAHILFTSVKRTVALVRQPHLVMFKALSLVVALFRPCLVDSPPV